jgi:signal peptidase I
MVPVPEDGPRWRTIAHRVWRSLGTVLALAVVGGAIFCAIALVRGTWMVTPVLSGSMTPGFSVGGVVVCERVPVSSLAVRDVIVFREPGRPSTQVIHRIVKLTDNTAGPALINTQGDANPAQDPWTLTIQGDVVYRADWSLPLIGYAAIFYQNHRGLAVLGAGILVLAVAASVALGEHGPSKGRGKGARPTPEEGAAPVTKSPDAGEPEAEPGEPEAEPGELGADLGVPEAEPGELGADLGVPEAEPGVPEAERDELGADLGVPEAEPGELEAERDELEAEPGVPEAEPGELETGPGELEAEPREAETEVHPERGGAGHKKWSSKGSRRG